MNASLGTIHNSCTNQILICCILQATWKTSWLFLLWHSYVTEQKEPVGVESSDVWRPRAHFTNNVFITIQMWWYWITAKWNFHQILIVMAIPLVKWVAQHNGWYFQMHFRKQKVLRLDFNINDIYLQWSKWQSGLIDLDNGLAPTKWPAITWTSDNKALWYHISTITS